MERLLKILEEVVEKADVKNATDLVENGILDSMDIITIVTRIEEEFNIEIDANEIDPDNFQSVESMWNMVKRVMG